MVMKIEDVLQLDHIEAHEVVKDRGMIVEWRSGMGPVIFVSHTWLGISHPDRGGIKLKLLQAFLERALKGKARVEPHWSDQIVSGSKGLTGPHIQKSIQGGYVWLDYWSVPQFHAEDQKKAIQAIHSYVQESAVFVCLVPSCLLPSPVHEDGSLRDYTGWKRRGWCRVEATSNFLSPFSKPCIIIDSTSSYSLAYSGESSFLLPVGLGDFTVENDKQFLRPVLEQVISARLSHALHEGDLTYFRFLASIRDILLQGFCTDTCDSWADQMRTGTCESWLEGMHFSTDQEPLDGWTPLRFAAYANRVDVVQELLRRKANVEAPLTTTRLDLGNGHAKGATILQSTSWIRDAPEVLDALMEHRADPLRRNAASWNSNAFASACVGGRCENIHTILRRAPEASDGTFHDGTRPFVGACYYGQSQTLQLLLDHFPEHVDTDAAMVNNAWGHNMLSACVSHNFGETLQTLKLLLERKSDVNRMNRPSSELAKRLVRRARLRCHLQRNPDILWEFIALTPATPTCLASFHGSLGVLQLLIRHEADVNQPCGLGRTPLIAAAMRGHAGSVELLLAAGARAAARDAWGRSAGDWALLRGHDELAQRLRERAGAEHSPPCSQRRCGCPCRRRPAAEGVCEELDGQEDDGVVVMV